MKYPKIKYVESLENYKLFLIFDNGIIKTYSFEEKIKNPIYKALNDEHLFQKVKVEVGGYGVSWNDELDLSEFELWKNGVEISSIERLSHKIVA